jgi:hypothetical protein
MAQRHLPAPPSVLRDSSDFGHVRHLLLPWRNSALGLRHCTLPFVSRRSAFGGRRQRMDPGDGYRNPDVVRGAWSGDLGGIETGAQPHRATRLPRAVLHRHRRSACLARSRVRCSPLRTIGSPRASAPPSPSCGPACGLTRIFLAERLGSDKASAKARRSFVRGDRG